MRAAFSSFDHNTYFDAGLYIYLERHIAGEFLFSTPFFIIIISYFFFQPEQNELTQREPFPLFGMLTCDVFAAETKVNVYI